MLISGKGILRMPLQGEPLPPLEIPARAIAIGPESGQIWATTSEEVLKLNSEGKPILRYPLGRPSSQSWIAVR